MKTLFFAAVSVAALSPLNVTLPFQVQPVVAGDNEGTLDIDVADIARLQVRLLTDGETGIGRLLTTSGANRYELDGTNIVLHVANSDRSVLQYKLTVSGSYGQVKLNVTIVLNVKPDGEASIVLEPYVFDAIAAGGGGDYKTDIYMDGDGRVMVERLEDGSTVILDEHENPILKRNADGSTEYYDAFQSVKQKIAANGAVSIYAPLSQGYGNAIAENSHAEGIGATASSFARGGHAEGRQTLVGNCYGAHAEGYYSSADADYSHSEGTSCKTFASTSHAEGNYCETGTEGGSAHAEGSYTNANGAASHTEGYRTTTTEGGSHAQGCWNKVEGGQFAFMHGCGTDADNRKNAFLIAGDEVYMFGIGGYDGTNYGAEGVKSVQTVIRELQLKLINF